MIVRFPFWAYTALFCALCTPVNAAPDATLALHPQDFAYSREVVLPPDQTPLAAVELPADVYRASRSAGLLDVLVFNASSSPVPDALQRPAAELAKAQTSISVPFFPMTLEQASAPIELALSITRGSDGQVLALRSQTPEQAQGAQSARPVGAYVLDLRSTLGPNTTTTPRLTAARFEWLETPTDLILPLLVESSDDLIHWQAIPVEGGILHLEHDGKRIDRDRIEWSPMRADFMRVRALGKAGLPSQLQAVQVEAARTSIAPKLERVAVSGNLIVADRPVFRFDMGGPVPVEELEVELPEDNSVIAAELLSAHAAAGPYKPVAQANFYRVSTTAAAPLHGPRLRIAPQTARFYELRVDPSRARVDNGVPKLITYHVPERLLFLRRGAAPFTLAYGRHDVQRQRFSPDEMLGLLHDGSNARPTAATLSERAIAGGEQLLQPPPPPTPYKTYALWAALIAGVALLAWLSVRLLRGDA
ncbi:MAG TPA: DUF3999 family protein [Polyangiales bacterium]|nr:DUF3999 family protein [Polyangiales bacterium]